MQRFVLPVIHHLDDVTTMAEAALAFRAGADGVFLISHRGADAELPSLARALKQRQPGRLIGVNLLSLTAEAAFAEARRFALDMVWADDAGVSSKGVSAMGERIAASIASRSMFGGPQVFGSVAFKYQPDEPAPGPAAQVAHLMGMVPTTSGSGTGAAPSVGKIRGMRDALGADALLAVASGMTPENVREFAPYVTHFLVATGVSKDHHHFDEERLTEFVKAVAAYRG